MLRMLPNAHSFMALSAKPQTVISSGVADCQNKTKQSHASFEPSITGTAGHYKMDNITIIIFKAHYFYYCVCFVCLLFSK